MEILIPVIDLNDDTALKQIEEAYTTIGFAVFTNHFNEKERSVYNLWFDTMKQFFEMDLETKMKYPYEGDTNLGYSVMGAENVDPTAQKDLKESFNYNNDRMGDHLWPDIPGFKSMARTTVTIADKLTLKIMMMFDRILKRPDMPLTHAHKTNYSTTRVIHYPIHRSQ